MNVRVLIGTGFRFLGDLFVDSQLIKKRVNRYKTEKIRKKYKGKTIYYVMRFQAETFGIATSIRYVLSNLKYANDNGLIPIVDMQNEKNPYLEEQEVGKKNAWEFYFNQPAQITLKDIEGKENVIYAEEAQLEECPTDSMEFYTNDFAVNFWRKIYRENIVLNEESKKHIEEQYTKLFGNEHQKILGCICRGTDYVERRAYKHPIQPKVEALIHEAKEFMLVNAYDKIFLATEDEFILEQFKEAFGEKLIYVEQQRYKDGSIPLARQQEFATRTNRRIEGLNYLTAIYLLAECDSLIGSRCGITTISYIISKGFEYTHLWNLGRYGIDDYCLPENYL